MEDFLSLLYEFEEAGEEQGSMVHLYRSLRCVLQDNTELLRDFAAFLQPEQALECGLVSDRPGSTHVLHLTVVLHATVI